MKKILILFLAVIMITATGCSLLDDSRTSGEQPGTASTGAGTDIGSGTGNNAGNSSGGNGQAVGHTNQNNQGKPVQVTLYFATEDNSALKKETRELKVKDGAILKACISALLEGPQAAGLRKTIPEGTALLGVNLKDKVAIIDFSKEYNTANGIAEITARLSLVNTLTGIHGVEKVRIMVEGKDLIGPSGKPFGEMEAAALDTIGMPISGQIKKVTLYFANSNADAVVAEKREATLPDGESLEKIIFLELMKGPETKGLHATIPKGTQLLSIKTADGICTLDLSKEFVDNSPGGTAGESMTLESIISSLTELDHIKKVQFLIEGKKREVYLHVIFDKPFERNEGMISKK